MKVIMQMMERARSRSHVVHEDEQIEAHEAMRASPPRTESRT
jgi:hypothetical protein